MRLTAYTNYALRTLMFAALEAPNLVRVQDVAEAHGISRTHLVKCVHQLGQWGYLVNVRGRGGGFRLARPAEAITIGEIVRRTEEGFDLVECFSPETASCPLVGRCRLSTALEKARDVFLEELDGVTIADITTNGGEVLSILDLDGGGPMASECDALRAAADVVERLS